MNGFRKGYSARVLWIYGQGICLSYLYSCIGSCYFLLTAYLVICSCIWVGVPGDYCMCCFSLDENGL